MSNKYANAYDVDLVNGVHGSGYAFYFDGKNQNVYSGVINSPKVTISMPGIYTGKGMLHVTIPRKGRTYSTIHMRIAFDIGPGKENIIDMTYKEPEVATNNETGGGKKLVTNKLKKKVEERKKEIDSEAGNEDNEKGKQSFWDKIK